MDNEEFASYDFLINEEDEVMLLLYAREQSPQNPSIRIDATNKTAFLQRTTEDIITLSDVPEEALDSLAETDKLLVCELSAEENEKDTQIVYAYEADVTD